MKKLLLLSLVALGGVMNASAWGDMYLICKENGNWSVDSYGAAFQFVKVDDTHYRATVPGSYINNGNWNFRFREKNGDWYNIGPIGSTEADNTEVTGTAVQTNYKNSDNASFYITQDPAASFVQIFIEWADPYWKVTSSVINTTYTIAYGNVDNWSNVKAYAYYNIDNCPEQRTLGNWPGSALSSYGTITVPAIAGGMVIFNDGQETNGSQHPASGGFNVEENGVYGDNGIVSNQSVSAGSGIATFSSAYPLDFTSASGITAYTVSNISSTSATLTPVTEVPAGTGLIIKGSGSVTIPTKIVTSSVGTNKLQAAVAATNVADNYAYVLSGGVFHPASAGTIPAGKAYLLKTDVPAQARSLSLMFDDATGIGTMQTMSVEDNVFYNLGGQRVAVPTKGMYIVNGKKVIVK